MEDHIQMGALMFSLLTIEMMYTSMDYLAAGNFRRGNGYLLHMYTPLPLRLDRLLKKLVAEYDEERQRLMSTRVQPAGSNDGVAEDAAVAGGRTPPLNTARRGTGRSAGDYFTAFDPNQFVQNTAAAAAVAAELTTVRKFVDFIGKFVEVRKTMVVLYRFVAATGPVLHVRKLRLLLGHCAAVLETIETDALYGKLLEHVRGEVRLVCELVEWDAHVTAYDFARAVAAMHAARRLLSAWRAEVVMGSEASMEKDAAGEAPGVLRQAFARSARLVQGLLWGAAVGGETGGPRGGRMRGIVVWLDRWTAHLAFRTTAYFQRHLLHTRALHTPDAASDIWRRRLCAPDLHAMIGGFLRAFDGECVALLFASSAARPFAPDGVAVSGTRQHVPLARVQACATLFCQRRAGLDNTDVHAHVHEQDEWLRQNFLPDILCVLDAEQAAMDAELLGAAPLLAALGEDADALLDELAGSMRDALAAAVVARATRGGRRDSRDARGRHDQRTPSQPAEDSLYSTYLLKSHLRNNLAPDPMAIRLRPRAEQPRRPSDAQRMSTGTGELSVFVGRRAPSVRSVALGDHSEVARRVRRGERLVELFGGWDAEGTAHKPVDLAMVPPELAYSTLPRASVGRRSDVVESEGFTYLYARVAMPNVTLVAVLGDSERALPRRREAMRVWDQIVAAVRGTPLLDLLLTLS
ncbi:hypothetical protein IW150_004746 [Coemansia sp. RSA 2607]|nr:hypothetical protein IW150_004746 [Coemansia sp. RSA 2607]